MLSRCEAHWLSMKHALRSTQEQENRASTGALCAYRCRAAVVLPSHKHGLELSSYSPFSQNHVPASTPPCTLA